MADLLPGSFLAALQEVIPLPGTLSAKSTPSFQHLTPAGLWPPAVTSGPGGM